MFCLLRLPAMAGGSRWTDERLDDRFGQIDKRFDRLEAHMDSRFAEVSSRFNDLGGRLDSLNRSIIVGTATLVAAVLLEGLLGG